MDGLYCMHRRAPRGNLPFSTTLGLLLGVPLGWARMEAACNRPCRPRKSRVESRDARRLAFFHLRPSIPNLDSSPSPSPSSSRSAIPISMAPTTRTRRSQRASSSAAPTLEVTDGHNLQNGPGKLNGEASHRHPRDGSHVDAHDSDAQRPWTPEPEPYNDDTYTAWGRKHFGEDWYQQRSIMLEERDIYAREDPVYKARQEALRNMEEERQAGKLPPRAMTWNELNAWKPLHYGPVWCRHRDAYPRLMAEADKAEAEGKPEAEQLGSRSRRHEDAMTTIQVETDAELLAEGKTWREILSFPPLGPAEGDGPVYRSPSPSSDGSGIRTFPPTPAKFDHQARVGPMPEGYIRDEDRGKWDWYGSANQWDWKWDREQWLGIHHPDRWVDGDNSPQERYEANIKDLARSIRSYREDTPGTLLRKEELEFLYKIRLVPPHYCMESEEYLRRKRHFDRKWEGWSQEQIDAEDQADPEPVQRRVKELEEERKKPPKDKEEMNLKFFQWNYQRLSREEQEQLGRMHGFPNRHLFPVPEVGPWYYRNFEELSKPTRPRPKNEMKMDRLLFLWKLVLSDKELAELARLYGFDTDKRPDGLLVSRALPSRPPKTASARRGRRATKKAPQSPSTRAARPRRSVPASEGPPPDQGPGRASRRRTAQPKPVPAAPSATKSRAAEAPAPRKNPKSRNANLAQKPDTLHRRLSPDRVAKKPPWPRTTASVQHPVVSRSGRLSKAPERLGFTS